jgi:hypothetical protein
VPSCLAAGLGRDDVLGKGLSDILVRMDGTQLPSIEDLKRIAKLDDFKVRLLRHC